jgi:hypothetical protein
MDDSFQPTNELEQVLVRAATDPTARPAFYRKLLASQLFFLTPAASVGDQTKVAQSGEQVELISWGDSDGSFLPIFSSRERITQAIAGLADTMGKRVPAYACLSALGQAAFAMLAQAPTQAVLNPGLPFAKQFAVEEIRALADGSLLGGEPITTGTLTDVVFTEPAPHPRVLIDTLCKLFASYPAVEAAFLAEIHDRKSPLPAHPIVGIVGRGCGDALQEAGMLASEIVQGPVDFVEIEPEERDGLAGYLRSEVRPFYLRAHGQPSDKRGP